MLMLACFGGHVATGKALLAMGASIGARNAWDCDAGHFAGMGGCPVTCAWLADECGVLLDRRQRSGHTALHKAADCGREEAVGFLLVPMLLLLPMQTPCDVVPTLPCQPILEGSML